MTHWSSSPRGDYIVVHHHGEAGTEDADACFKCYVEGSHYYDFCVNRAGYMCINADSGGGQFWTYATGGHALEANCNTIGVMMQGCYGGCPSGNLCCFSDAQLCALASISFHLDVPTPNLYNHISHNKAASWQPCPCGYDCGQHPCAACPTYCCGTNLQTSSTAHGWTYEGEIEMNRMLWMRSNLAAGCNCTGEICS